MNEWDTDKGAERILAGEPRAVREFYGAISPKLKRFFGSRVGQELDVDELIQDTFLHFLDALPLFRQQSSLSTFLFGIARHELMDYWRKRYAKRMIRTVPMLSTVAASIQSSEAVSEKMQQAMEAAYAQLAPLQVIVLRGKYEEGKSVKQLAQDLGWTSKAVEAQLYRARRAFQEVYIPIEEWE